MQGLWTHFRDEETPRKDVRYSGVQSVIAGTLNRSKGALGAQFEQSEKA
jgi:hypothetical protein